MQTFKIAVPPPPVGYWSMGQPVAVRFYVTSRPNWFHRTMIRLCFGINWHDIVKP